MTPRASERGWEILAKFVQERVQRAGPDGDLTDEQRDEERASAAEEAKRLLKDQGFQRLRLQGLEEVVKEFASWLALDPAGPNYQRELMGIHLRASCRYWELFRPEMVIAEARDSARKRNREEETHGLGLREGRQGRHRRGQDR